MGGARHPRSGAAAGGAQQRAPRGRAAALTEWEGASGCRLQPVTRPTPPHPACCRAWPTCRSMPRSRSRRSGRGGRPLRLPLRAPGGGGAAPHPPWVYLPACPLALHHLPAALPPTLSSLQPCHPPHSVVTNTFDFIFSYVLERDEDGAPVPPKMVLPCSGEEGSSGGRRRQRPRPGVPGSTPTIACCAAPPRHALLPQSSRRWRWHACLGPARRASTCSTRRRRSWSGDAALTVARLV